jgi:hypothetical protein
LSAGRFPSDSGDLFRETRSEKEGKGGEVRWRTEVEPTT